jgi:hypothetical protein
MEANSAPSRIGAGQIRRRMEKIQLDRETHLYTPNLPSVTEILQDVALIDPTWFTDDARDRGSAVHLAAEYYDQGVLDYQSLDPRIEPYVRAYIAFRQAHPLEEGEWIEVPMMDPCKLYAGTADRIVRSRPPQLPKIRDLKTGPYAPSHKWQMAAYANMFEDPASFLREGLYLRPNGTYKIREFPQEEFPTDLNVWNAALTIYYTKRQEKI